MGGAQVVADLVGEGQVGGMLRGVLLVGDEAAVEAPPWAILGHLRDYIMASPRLRELAPMARGSQDANSRNCSTRHLVGEFTMSMLRTRLELALTYTGVIAVSTCVTLQRAAREVAGN